VGLSGLYCVQVAARQLESNQRRRIISSLVLCSIGLAIAGYTLWVHWHPGGLICPVKAGPIDCAAVLTSAQSKVIGIPVPIYGIVFFLVLGTLCLPRAWRSLDERIHLLRLVVVTVGILTVLYLISTELFTIKKICLWCTGVHIVTFVLFAIVVTSTPSLLEQARSSGALAESP
jgi:uncharacterized membrane protein